MNKIKLYTEEQVNEISKYFDFPIKVINQLLKITPIELPSDDEAGVVALKIIATLKDELTTQEESFFLAGFQTCDKYIKEQIKNK